MNFTHVVLTSVFAENSGYHDPLLAKHQVLQGHRVSVISFPYEQALGNISTPQAYWHKDGYKIYRLILRKSLFFGKFRWYSGLRKVLENESPDVIFVHGIQTAELSTVFSYKLQHPNCIVVADTHADYRTSATNFLSLNFLHKILWSSYLKRYISCINHIYATLPWRKKFFHEVYGINYPVEMLYMGADDSVVALSQRRIIRQNIRSRYGIDDSARIYIHGGRLDQAKKTHLVIEKFLQLVSLSKSYLFVFGDFIDNEYRTKCFELANGNQRIFFLGKIEPVDIYSLFLTSDVALFPGGHSVLWEQAVYCGLPCIFWDWPESDYLGKDHRYVKNDSEFFYELESIADLSQDQLDELSDSIQKYGCKTFSCSAITKQLMTTLEDDLRLLGGSEKL